MKKFSLLIAVLAIVSCHQESVQFNGFGGFDLGKDFASLPNAKAFVEVMDGEFNLPEYTLSDDIGSVNNLHIITHAGKIIEVSFTANSRTNVAEVKKAFQGMILFGAHEPSKTDKDSFRVFHTKDSTVFMSELVSGSHANALQRRYSYANKKGVEKKREIVKKMLSADAR